jgi:hypothetical protein
MTTTVGSSTTGVMIVGAGVPVTSISATIGEALVAVTDVFPGNPPAKKTAAPGIPSAKPSNRMIVIKSDMAGGWNQGARGPERLPVTEDFLFIVVNAY